MEVRQNPSLDELLRGERDAAAAVQHLPHAEASPQDAGAAQGG